MKIVDGFDRISSFLTFENEDEFYYVVVMRRKKDNPGDNPKEYDESIANVFDDAIYLGGWVIEKYTDLLEYRDEIVSLCEENHARAYITINPRTYERVNKEVEFRKANNMNPGAEFMMSAASIKRYNEPEYEWEKINPRVLVDIDTDDSYALAEAHEILSDNNIEILFEINSPCGGAQFVVPDRRIFELREVFDRFDNYHMVGKPEGCTKCRAVNFLPDTMVNLYANLDKE